MFHYHTLGYVACCAGQCGGPQSLQLDVYFMIIAILLVGRWNLKVVSIYISQLSRDDELCSFFFYKYLLSFVVIVYLRVNS